MSWIETARATGLSHRAVLKDLEIARLLLAVPGLDGSTRVNASGDTVLHLVATGTNVVLARVRCCRCCGFMAMEGYLWQVDWFQGVVFVNPPPPPPQPLLSSLLAVADDHLHGSIPVQGGGGNGQQCWNERVRSGRP